MPTEKHYIFLFGLAITDSLSQEFRICVPLTTRVRALFEYGVKWAKNLATFYGHYEEGK